jgi:hypothetical protein
MNVATLPTLTTLDELIDEAISLARAGDTIAAAVTETLNRAEPDDEAVERLVHVGLRTLVQQAINEPTADVVGVLEKPSGSRLRPNGVARPSRIEAGLALLSSLSLDIGGQRKAPLLFTIADCEYVASHYEAMAKGASVRAKAMRLGAALMRTEKVGTIGELSEKSRGHVALYLGKAEAMDDER